MPAYLQRTLFAICLLTTGICLTQGASPPVTEGLIHLFDASNQAALRKSQNLPQIGNGKRVDQWLDSRTNFQALTQPHYLFRPTLVEEGSQTFLRFDGKDDSLQLTTQKRDEKTLTFVLLAAPRSNPGSFSGMISSAAQGQNDYTSGLNLDQGPDSSTSLSSLSVESSGAAGFKNLLEPGKNLASILPFENFHVFTIQSRKHERDGNSLWLDGIKLGDRSRTSESVALDELIVGARFYSNDPNELPHVQSHFHGDIAAVAIYNRILTTDERVKVEEFFMQRSPALNALASGSSGHALETVIDAPVVQMLVPGFEVNELPLRMRNLNGVRYRHDGKVVGLGYDGRVHLIWDSNNDGLEDSTRVFWDKSSLRGPMGMALLPASDPRGDGVIIASKGKISLILDKNRDGDGDEEIIVASGWTEIAPSVDAIGVAINPKDGWIYFGLGTANYANAYLLDSNSGKAAYTTAIQNGTVQRVSPDFKHRETVCTGTRFTCALAFNHHGDLFATEQEGATWLPNGNAFDELLHIQTGKHYGFPPRHPVHLPNVIDEPAVFEYSPQHQSTVGIVFNQGVNGGPHFGPSQWLGDALVCGESRGKLYRTQLVKTDVGYVARNHLIACLGLLTVDTCVTPEGDLLVACHTGQPDWGTGPAGEGRLFRIRYANKDIPQPVQAWASAPDEFRIAFDRPLHDQDWIGAVSKTKIEAGKHVSAGDRFEVIRPGYQIVRDQMTSPRRWIKPQSLSLSTDRRTIVLRIPIQRTSDSFAITLPKPVSWQHSSAIRQHPEIDLTTSLHGVVAKLSNPLSTPLSSQLSVVLPHPNLDISKQLTRGSSDHEAFYLQLDKLNPSINLSMSTIVDVRNVFVPAVQAGSTLDWDPLTDPFAKQPMALATGPNMQSLSEHQNSANPDHSLKRFEWNVRSTNALVNPIHFVLGERKQPIPLNRVHLPWREEASLSKGSDPGISHSSGKSTSASIQGEWLNGRRAFFGSAGCATCHTIRGEGISFGPDLTNLIHRDRGSVEQDIRLPSAAINPDHTGVTVTLKDGNVVQGMIKEFTDQRVVLRLPANAEFVQPRNNVSKIEPMKQSLMPETFGANIDPNTLNDLITFLLINPLEPASITRLDPPPPPPRSRQEILDLTGSLTEPSTSTNQLRILLCIDSKDHGVDEHDYPRWQSRWHTLLSLAPGIKVAKATGFPTRAQLENTDVAVFFSRNAGWNLEAGKLMDEFQARGGGLVYLHWGMEGGKNAVALAERIGLATEGTGYSKYRHGEIELHFPQPEHPITRGLQSLKLTDETYWKFHGLPERIRALATAVEDKGTHTQLWTLEKGKARVFGSIPGHYTWTMDDPVYRVIVLRGLAWVAHDPDVNRLVELAPVGARIRSN